MAQAYLLKHQTCLNGYGPWWPILAVQILQNIKIIYGLYQARVIRNNKNFSKLNNWYLTTNNYYAPCSNMATMKPTRQLGLTGRQEKPTITLPLIGPPPPV
jgi:hypothetical protein